MWARIHTGLPSWGKEGSEEIGRSYFMLKMPGKKKWIRSAFFLSSLALLVVCLPEASRADNISGYLDFRYSIFNSKTKQMDGTTTKTRSEEFDQLYNIIMDKTLYPNLRLYSNNQFEQDRSDSKVEGTENYSVLTKWRTDTNLELKSQVFPGRVGYLRREEKTDPRGQPSTTLVNEEYRSELAWKPAGLPETHFWFTKTNNYDKDKESENTTEDLYRLNSIYREIKGLDLFYFLEYDKNRNKLNDLTVAEWSHLGRISYFRKFLDNRLSFYGNYNIDRRETEVTTSGKGEVDFQVFATSGLSSIDDSPENGALDPNAALIDSNLTASAGINIGLPPLGGNTQKRNMGLDFFDDKEINSLWVWIDREIPAGIANSFSWDVYTSTDNLNWTFYRTVFPATFDVFKNRFEIAVPAVTVRYIKVVTKPLTAAVPNASQYPDIFVTELQAYLSKPAKAAKGKTTETTHFINSEARYSLFDTPETSLSYLCTFNFRREQETPTEDANISNGFIIDHTFSNMLKYHGFFSREEIEDQKEWGYAYAYNSSFTANPLNTLRNSLVFSGRKEKIGGETTQDTNSVFLYNNAILYEGISVDLFGGLSFNKEQSGIKRRTALINFISNIIPHRTVSLNLTFLNSETHQTGGGEKSDITFTRRSDFSLSYNPFSSLYIYCSASVLDEDEGHQTLQNYGVNWSPFPDSALQFKFFYTEELFTENNERNRIIQPSLRWNLSKRSYLEASYQIIKSVSDIEKTDTNIFFTEAKIFF